MRDFVPVSSSKLHYPALLCNSWFEWFASANQASRTRYSQPRPPFFRGSKTLNGPRRKYFGCHCWAHFGGPTCCFWNCTMWPMLRSAQEKQFKSSCQYCSTIRSVWLPPLLCICSLFGFRPKSSSQIVHLNVVLYYPISYCSFPGLSLWFLTNPFNTGYLITSPSGPCFVEQEHLLPLWRQSSPQDSEPAGLAIYR